MVDLKQGNRVLCSTGGRGVRWVWNTITVAIISACQMDEAGDSQSSLRGRIVDILLHMELWQLRHHAYAARFCGQERVGLC